MYKRNIECNPGTRAAWVRLGLALLSITLVWGWGLPWLAEHEPMQQQLKFLEQRGIDPSAMFYTELDAMVPILDRLERREGRG